MRVITPQGFWSAVGAFLSKDRPLEVTPCGSTVSCVATRRAWLSQPTRVEDAPPHQRLGPAFSSKDYLVLEVLPKLVFRWTPEGYLS